jgi:hypothetical protein
MIVCGKGAFAQNEGNNLAFCKKYTNSGKNRFFSKKGTILPKKPTF